MVYCGWYFCNSSSKRPKFGYLEKIKSRTYTYKRTYVYDAAETDYI